MLQLWSHRRRKKWRIIHSMRRQCSVLKVWQMDICFHTYIYFTSFHYTLHYSHGASNLQWFWLTLHPIISFYCFDHTMTINILSFNLNANINSIQEGDIYSLTAMYVFTGCTFTNRGLRCSTNMFLHFWILNNIIQTFLYPLLWLSSWYTLKLSENIF